MKDIIKQDRWKTIWRDWRGWVYKQSQNYPWWLDNSLQRLQSLYWTGYVPFAERVDDNTIRIEDLGPGEPITREDLFMSHLPLVIKALRMANIRHGDLAYADTVPPYQAVIPIDNKPFLIDFSESLDLDSGLPNKQGQAGTDTQLLEQTMLFYTSRWLRPLDYFPRSSARWRIISRRVNFRGQRVLDLGAGPGDMLWRTHLAGARDIYAADLDQRWFMRVLQPCITYNIENVHFQIVDINQWDEIQAFQEGAVDIILALSVLPYLLDMCGTLQKISEHCRAAVIEVQYAGDGPGPAFLASDNDMRNILMDAGFEHVEILGYVWVDQRMAWRTIWLASREPYDPTTPND